MATILTSEDSVSNSNKIREFFTKGSIRLKRKSFQMNLLLSIGGIFLLFAVCFSVYQYQREKEYKIDIMHSMLQMFNYELIQTIRDHGCMDDLLFHDFEERHNVEGLRVTVIDKTGHVLFDSYDANIDLLDNHLQRTEIQQALREGSGYDIKRTSESTHETFFYSATNFDDMIIRTAVPYSAALTRSLQADNTYIYFAIVLTLLLGIVLFWSTRRISRHIEYLREFAVHAEEGESIDREMDKQLPNDELGDISRTIITLYWRLRHSEQEKVRIKRQLTQNAAHELKTPAASIHGYLESILDNPNMEEEKRQHFLERCYAQSERMSKLLYDMSTLTKLDELEMSNRDAFRQIDVLPIIHNVLDDTSLQLQENGIEVFVDVPSSTEVYGDQSLLYSIFCNLLDNVISHATGANRLYIVCKEKEVDGKHFYEFLVSDNGQGVTSQHLDYLFERFYRVDKGRSRKLGGTGLGLAIVKNAVAAHGGTTTAEQTDGGGLTIRFTLARF